MLFSKGPVEDVLPTPAEEAHPARLAWINHQMGRTAEKITGASLPSVQDLYSSRIRNGQEASLQIYQTLHIPELSQLLPFGRRRKRDGTKKKCTEVP